MNSRSRAMLVALTVVFVMTMTAVGAIACTSIALPPGSIADGSAIATHTADSGSFPLGVLQGAG